MAKKSKRTGQAPAKATEPLLDSTALLADRRELIEAARASVAQAVHSAQVILHWRVGHRILADILKYQRATYGDPIVATVSRQLTADYGRGFAEKSLCGMIPFANLFPDPEIVATIELEPLRRDHPLEDRPPTQVLCGDVSHRAVGRPHASG